jgi:UPF0755 protein
MRGNAAAMSRRARWVFALVLAATLAAAAAALVFAGWRSLDEPLALPAEGYVLDVEAGTPLAGIVRRLHDEGFVRWRQPLTWYARWTGLASKVKAGEYLLAPTLTPRGLLDQLVAGRVRLHAVTFVEGWTFAQMLAALENHPAVAHTLANETPASIMKALGADEASPEGLFFPDTYRFARGTRDLAILEQAYAAMRAQLEAAWATRASGLPFDTPYEALVLASLVEKETSIDGERTRIAGVYVKRLRLGMRLQSDPTVIYGLGTAFDGDLRTADLLKDTPYNTYTRAGLPPTPIAMPGAASLRAAVQPEETDALYFVATGDGGHQFSATLAEHQRAVQRYLRRLGSGSTPQ